MLSISGRELRWLLTLGNFVVWPSKRPAGIEPTLLQYPNTHRFSIPGVGNKYKYSFSPCSPAPCGGSYATVCQKDVTSGTENICGVNAAWTIYTLHPLNFTISYTVPGSSRQTLVKFDGKEGPQNYSTAVAEYYTNSYNFNITMAVGPGTSYWNKAMKKLSTMFFFKNG
ncbi:hypothetical protein EMCRGX_G008404 [Ephydatia muelleri]